MAYRETYVSADAQYAGDEQPGRDQDSRGPDERQHLPAALHRAPGQALLIDAANEPGRLIELIGDVPVGTIVTTHPTADHWQALGKIRVTGAEVVAHPADADELPVTVTHRAEHGEVLRFGDAEVSVIHLRRHTPGSIAILYDASGQLAGEPHVFTGDSLFPGGVGKTVTPETFASLLTDVTERLFVPLPDATWVYPGHGNDTMLGAERPHLGEWRERGW